MSKVNDLERSIEVIGGQLSAVQMLIEAIIVEGIRIKTIDEKEITILFDQGLDAFQNNANMGAQEKLGAIGTLTSVMDMIKRAEDAGILP